MAASQTIRNPLYSNTQMVRMKPVLPCNVFDTFGSLTRLLGVFFSNNMNEDVSEELVKEGIKNRKTFFLFHFFITVTIK